MQRIPTFHVYPILLSVMKRFKLRAMAALAALVFMASACAYKTCPTYAQQEAPAVKKADKKATTQPEEAPKSYTSE